MKAVRPHLEFSQLPTVVAGVREGMRGDARGVGVP